MGSFVKAKKIIACFSVFAIVISALCIPVFASDFSGDRDSGGGGRYEITDFYGFAGGRDFGGGGRFSSKEAYTDYVGTLPATGWTSEGHLIWQVGVEDIIVDQSFFAADTAFSVFLNGGDSNFSSSVLSNHKGFHIVYGKNIHNFGYMLYINVPFDGYYKMLSSIMCLGHYASLEDISLYYASKSLEHYSFESYIYVNRSFNSLGSDSANAVFDWYLPVFEVVPDTALSGDQYNVTTRPTTITGGNYGIVGDNNELTIVNGDIINETNNTYYNPATGKSETINSWSYDYSDRSYNVTFEDGSTATVVYGDENITIIEGDVTYIIYYIMDGTGSGSGSGSDDGCVHEWYLTGHRQGNCLTAEQRTYTCYQCGKQYTETDPAPGHSWHIIQTVSTKYDDSGSLIQEGYTIYECERCGEQYKSTNYSGEPSTGGSSSGGSSGSDSSDNIFSGIFGVIWDFFSFFFDFFSDFVVGGITGFISAIMDSASDFFSILNPFDWGY